MRALSWLLAAAVLFITGAAQARTIESGIYYNPSEPGRGFSIELQGGQMTIIFFAYDLPGEPVWYYASAPYVLNATGYPTMSATLGRYADGQCLGCTYVPPVASATDYVTVRFSSPTEATLTMSGAFGSGTTISIGRFDFSDARNPLLGQWTWGFTVGATPSFSNTFGGYVYFTTLGSPVSAGGTGFLTGSPSGYGAECYASGGLVGQCLVVYVGSDSYSETFLFPIPTNELTGTWRLGSDTTSYPLKGVRVAVPGEPQRFGTAAAAPLAATPDDQAAQATVETIKRAAVQRAAGGASAASVDNESLRAAAAALEARIRARR